MRILEMSDMWVFDGVSGDLGGGVWGTLTDVQIDACNSTVAAGGGAYLDYHNGTYVNVEFTRNSGTEGGGLVIESGGHSMENATFTNNSATGVGGAIMLKDVDLSVTGGTLAGNTASLGVIRMDHRATLQVDPMTFGTNTGGDIYADASYDYTGDVSIFCSTPTGCY